jgi:hypothetical protein
MSWKPSCGCPRITRLMEDFMDPDDKDFRKTIILIIALIVIVII